LVIQIGWLYIYTIKAPQLSGAQKDNDMNTKQVIKREIEAIATETNCTFIEACQALQAAAAKVKNEKIIQIVHEIKMESIA
jgi:hypothetical protein